MNTQTHELYARRPPARSDRSKIGQRQHGSGGRGSRGRRRLSTFVVLAAAIGLIVAFAPRLEHAVRELALPLQDASVIRQQATEKHLDPGADRGRHLRGDQVRPAPLLRGCAGPDADPPQHGAVPRPSVGRSSLPSRGSRDAGDQHRVRELLPALPAEPLRGQRDAGGRRVQRGSDQRRRMGRESRC